MYTCNQPLTVRLLDVWFEVMHIGKLN
jgi:hypothetical protein